MESQDKQLYGFLNINHQLRQGWDWIKIQNNAPWRILALDVNLGYFLETHLIIREVQKFQSMTPYKNR